MGYDTDIRRLALLRAVKGLADEWNIGLIAEGVEAREEALREAMRSGSGGNHE